jgi:hypothetical protein
MIKRIGKGVKNTFRKAFSKRRSRRRSSRRNRVPATKPHKLPTNVATPQDVNSPPGPVKAA